MTSLQYTMFKDRFINSPGINLETEVYEVLQGTLASLEHNKWIRKTGNMLVATQDGKEEFYLYGSRSITRKNFSSALCKFLREIRNGNNNGKRKKRRTNGAK